jgi:hypothetical protein
MMWLGILIIVCLLSLANPPKKSEHDRLMDKERALSAFQARQAHARAIDRSMKK